MHTNELPPIPEKRYFTIGEVSKLCGVKPHVLRYWETEFQQLKPAKRRGNRRYYQLKDVVMIRHIRALLYEQGFTIGGAKQRLVVTPESPTPVDNDEIKLSLRATITDLEQLLQQCEKNVGA